MYVFTPVQNRTHVDTVQNVLCGFTNWSDIYWSHTMKALGSLVTFVRRNSSTVVTLRYTYCDMKVWSRMFVVNVQSVSIHHLIWNNISWYTRTSEALAVVYVLKVSSVNIALWYTLRDVLLASVLVTCNVCISLCVFSVSSLSFSQRYVVNAPLLRSHFCLSVSRLSVCLTSVCLSHVCLSVATLLSLIAMEDQF